MPEKKKYPAGSNPGKGAAPENFLGTTTPETATGLIGGLEAEGVAQEAQQQQIDIPLSIAPHLKGVAPGAQTELHIVATVGNVGEDNVTLNISKAFEMKTGEEAGAATPQVAPGGEIIPEA
jgi:hypothetical protein